MVDKAATAAECAEEGIGNCAPVSRAFCDIYIGGGGWMLWRWGGGERRVFSRILAEMRDGREIHRCGGSIFGVSIDFALLMIPA